MKPDIVLERPGELSPTSVEWIIDGRSYVKETKRVTSDILSHINKWLDPDGFLGPREHQGKARDNLLHYYLCIATERS